MLLSPNLLSPLLYDHLDTLQVEPIQVDRKGNILVTIQTNKGLPPIKVDDPVDVLEKALGVVRELGELG